MVLQVIIECFDNILERIWNGSEHHEKNENAYLSFGHLVLNGLSWNWKDL